MLVDKEKCVGCSNCLDYCPMKAISIVDDQADIDLNECVECGVCVRSGCCPTGALFRPKLEYPRDIACFFSDPHMSHPSTSIPGRGTEEMKTNEVTGRFPVGVAGIAVELGRPGIGTRFRDVELVARQVADIGAVFEPKNPVTALMSDKKLGTMPEELKDLKVLSAIVEFSVPIDKVPLALQRIKDIESRLETVFSLDLTTRCTEDNPNPFAGMTLPYSLSINGKTNVGLGKPRKEDRGTHL